MCHANPPHKTVARRRNASWTAAALALTSAIMSAGLHAADTTNSPPAVSKPEGKSNLMDMDLDSLARIEFRQITTASKKAELATDAPGTVQVITANDIYLRGYTTLADVLRDLPGMETTPFFFSEQGTAVTVRGVQGNNKLVVLVNGMRVNPPGGEWLPVRSDFFVKNAEQIEVVYGPGSTLYGADAINGVINIKTKDAVTAPLFEGAVDYGTDNSRTVWGSLNHVFDSDHGIKLNAFFGYHDSDLVPLDKEYPQWWRPIAASAAARGGVGETPYRQDFGINGFARIEGYNSSAQVWHRQSARSSSEGGFPDGYTPAAKWEDSSTVAELRNKLRLGDRYAVEHIVTYNYFEIDPSTRYVWEDTPTTWAPDDYKYGRGNSITFEQVHTYEASDKLDFLAGVVGGIFDIIPKATIPGGAAPDGNLFTQGGDFIYYTRPNDPTSITKIARVNEVKYYTVGGYAEGHYQLFDRLKLVGGSRIDTDSRFATTPVTPRAALVYDITPTLTAKYSYARAFVQPAPYFAYSVYQNNTSLAISNPNLQPESGQTHEINLTYHRPDLTLSGAAYYGTQDNLILVSDSNDPLNTIQTVWLDAAGTQPRNLVHSVNSGESHNYGIDLSGRAKFGSFNPWVSYSFVRSETQRGGKTTATPGISEHNGRLGLTWVGIPHLSITPSLMIRSKPESFTWATGTVGSMDALPYSFDLFALYNLSKNVDLYAKIVNLTDHHYGLPNILGFEAPQETISASAGVIVRF